MSSLWSGKSRVRVLQKWGALRKVTRDTFSIFSHSCKSDVHIYSQGKCKLSLFSWLQCAFIDSLQVWFCPIIFKIVQTNSKNVPCLCSAVVKLLIQILPGPHWVQLLLLDYLTLTVVLYLQDTVKLAFCLSPVVANCTFSSTSAKCLLKKSKNITPQPYAKFLAV